MLLACEAGPERSPLRVALATTHIPLSAVPAAVTRERLGAVLAVLVAGLRRDFGIAKPRIAVLGLNPHAGEAGELGSEDRNVVARAIEEFDHPGVTGPLPADTAFTPRASPARTPYWRCITIRACRSSSMRASAPR